jgi:hypothetical protein
MNKIHSLWIGDSLSTLERLSIISHLKNGHEYHLWTYADLEVPDGVILEDGNDILDESKIFCYAGPEEQGGGSVSAFSNLFRYKLLSEREVWWCDTDVVCLKPWDFDKKYITASEQLKFKVQLPTTCVFRIPKEVAYYCYSYAVSKDLKNVVWGEIGPELFAKCAYSPDMMSQSEVFCPIHWWEYEKIFDPFELPEESYGVHLWNEMWRRDNVDKDGIYKSNCLYEQLKKRYLGCQHKPMIL